MSFRAYTWMVCLGAAVGCASPKNESTTTSSSTSATTGGDPSTEDTADSGSDGGGDGGGGEIDWDALNGDVPAVAVAIPEFSARNMDGAARAREDVLGHPTVMWFYPAANTAG